MYIRLVILLDLRVKVKILFALRQDYGKNRPYIAATLMRLVISGIMIRMQVFVFSETFLCIKAKLKIQNQQNKVSIKVLLG